MARERKRSPRRTPRRNRRQERARKQLYQRGTVIALAALLAVGLGSVSVSQLSKAKPDEYGCLPETNDHTAMWVDSSVRATDEAQERAVRSAFEDIHNTLIAYERWTLITTERDHYDMVGGNRFTICAPDQGSNPNRAEKLRKELYTEEVEPKIKDVLQSFNIEEKRSLRSPVLESLQSISQRPDFSTSLGSRRLVLVGDMIQNTEIAQFCTTQGHLPSYPKFKELPAFANIKPASLQGVKVTIYMQVYPGAYGHAEGLPYCTENELKTFWTAYFEDAGAASVNIRPIRWWEEL